MARREVPSWPSAGGAHGDGRRDRCRGRRAEWCGWIVPLGIAHVAWRRRPWAAGVLAGGGQADT
eukprot:15675198-Heterocapsa_arctica.AAC.1